MSSDLYIASEIDDLPMDGPSSGGSRFCSPYDSKGSNTGCSLRDGLIREKTIGRTDPNIGARV